MRLARAIERELVGIVTHRLNHYFDRQVPGGREPIVTEDSAEVEVRFKIREAGLLPDATPDAHVILRELRTNDVPHRPVMYWYGLAQWLPRGEWLYEAFHLHDEPPHGIVSHFQRDFWDPSRRVKRSTWTPSSETHVVPAVERLLARYYERLAASEEHEGG